MGRRSKTTRGVGKKKKEECLLNNLTDELLIEVFVRLPSSKEAFRCKSVCNRWFTLISSNYFRNTSLIHNGNYDKTTLLPFAFGSIIEDEKSFYVIEFSTEKGLPRRVNLGFLYSGRPQDYRISLQGSYGDLILCSGNSSSVEDYYIVNVMTKQWVVLPPTPLESSRLFILISTSVGFLIMDNAEYLVLRFFPWSDSKFIIQMFLSEQGMWTNFLVTSPRNLNIFTRKTLIVACGRMLYTFTCKKRDVVDCVLAFDPFTNDPDQFLCVIDFPPEARDISCLACNLGVCGGRLRFAQLILQPSGYPCISIWELEDDYRKGKWTLVHKKIPTNTALKVPTLGHDTTNLVSVLAFHPFNKDLMCFLVGNDHVVMYNMQTDKVESCTCPSLLPYNEWQRSLPAVPITHSWWPTPVVYGLLN